MSNLKHTHSLQKELQERLHVLLTTRSLRLNGLKEAEYEGSDKLILKDPWKEEDPVSIELDWKLEVLERRLQDKHITKHRVELFPLTTHPSYI